MAICRACLSSRNVSNTMPLDEALESYKLLTNLNIVITDELPNCFCDTCVQVLKFYKEFREKCLRSEAFLQRCLLEKKDPKEEKPKLEIQIKEEVKLEVPSDDDDDDAAQNCFDDAAQNCFDDTAQNCFDNTAQNCFDDASFTKFEGCDFFVKTEDTKPKKRGKKMKLTLTEKIATIVVPIALECGLCKETFEEDDELNKHLDSHKKSKQCTLCNETFQHWPALLAHRMTHLAEKNGQCHICNKKTRSPEHLEYHYMAKHFEGEKQNLKCKECPRTFETPRKLKKHVNNSHKVRIFQCDTCSKIFRSKQGIKSHMKFHDLVTYVCDVCGFFSKQRQGLLGHKLRKHALEKVKCNKCRRLFASQEKHDRHKCRGTDVKVCPICGVQVPYLARLKQHIESHNNVRPHKCDRCPATYRSRQALKVHRDRHDGVRTKQCEFCPLKFFSKSVLIKHRRIHTGEKPYVCKVCQKGFTGRHNLKIHMKVHGEYLVKPKNKEPAPSIFQL